MDRAPGAGDDHHTATKATRKWRLRTTTTPSRSRRCQTRLQNVCGPLQCHLHWQPAPSSATRSWASGYSSTRFLFGFWISTRFWAASAYSSTRLCSAYSSTRCCLLLAAIPGKDCSSLGDDMQTTLGWLQHMHDNGVEAGAKFAAATSQLGLMSLDACPLFRVMS